MYVYVIFYVNMSYTIFAKEYLRPIFIYARCRFSMTFDDKFFIAKKIKEARKSLKYTQAQLAEMVNVNEQHISRIENLTYTPSLSLFFKLQKVLGLELSDFGISVEDNLSPLRREVLRMVYAATEKDLKHYKEVLEYLNKNFLE